MQDKASFVHVKNNSDSPVTIQCDTAKGGRLTLLPGISRDIPADVWERARTTAVPGKSRQEHPIVAGFLARGSNGGLSVEMG